MTDKQIIIDASQCEWRTGVEHCGYYECMLNKCCDYNCDWYKRRKLEQKLQAKEQEYERLKEAYTDCAESRLIFVNKTEEFLHQLDQLKAENETLKQYKSSKQASYESMQREWNNAVNENRELKTEIETLKSFDINLVGIKECEIRQLVQYRKALAEIKEIAESCYDPVDKDNDGFWTILQKISECEV